MHPHLRAHHVAERATIAPGGEEEHGDSQLMTLQGDQYDPAYMQLNPNAVAPTLVHDDKVIIAYGSRGISGGSENRSLT